MQFLLLKPGGGGVGAVDGVHVSVCPLAWTEPCHLSMRSVMRRCVYQMGQLGISFSLEGRVGGVRRKEDFSSLQ